VTPGLTFKDHRRDRLGWTTVYSVLSRRARGISLGINLNPDRICNWACAYCQVAREDEPKVAQPVDVARCLGEVTQLLEAVADGSVVGWPEHAVRDPAHARVVDLSFSGDGEPTTAACFSEIVDHVIAERQRLGLTDSLPLVVLSNCSMAQRPQVRGAIDRLYAANGAVHAKLDAGHAEGYRRVDRTAIPFAKTLANIIATAGQGPVVIQSLFCAIDGVFADPVEIAAYADCLSRILDKGGPIAAVHLHTVARQPPFTNVHGLSLAQLDGFAEQVVGREPRLAGCVKVFAGDPAYQLSSN
jgi:wyosine [tRNA(Phe)-imidazoG37] synthetase (radical SAM superfamily)